jgi:hypothetical protein
MPTKDPEKLRAKRARFRAKHGERLRAERSSVESKEKRRMQYAEKKMTNPEWVAYQAEKALRNKQVRKLKDPVVFREKVNAYRRKECKQWVEQAGDRYINTLLSKTGVKLDLYEVPKELIEAKRLQLQILRSIKNEKCNRT